MFENLKKNLAQNWTFFLVIVLFLSLVGTHLINFGHLEGHKHINQFHNEIADTFFRYFTHIGDGTTAVIIILILFFWRIKYGIIALIAFAFTAGITTGLKHLVFPDANRPILELWSFLTSDSGHLIYSIEDMNKPNSFPSGHTTSAMSIFCLLALIFKNKKIAVFFAVISCTAAFSRVYLSQHFMEDIFLGTIIGVLGTLMMYSFFINKLDRKFKDDKLTIKRAFDIMSSLTVLVIGLPFFIIISIIISSTSKGGVFFRQHRVGKNNQDFELFKFRTMKPNSEKLGQITVGGKDPRITRVGYVLRKFKLDEFPQLLNIIIGDMSIVGPRPEVRKYVALYNVEQLKVLSVKPGLTDFASIEYMDENVLLGNSSDPDQTYIKEVMPAKLNLNLKYIEQQSFGLDLKLIFRTIGKLFR